MEIIISNNANKPIYEQITSQIKSMIMSGELKPGEAIPSMRYVSKVDSCKCHYRYKKLMRTYRGIVVLETGVGERGSFCICTK